MKRIALILFCTLVAGNLWAEKPNPHEGMKGMHSMKAHQGMKKAPALQRNTKTPIHIMAVHAFPAIRATPAAVYMHMKNTSKQEDTLLSASSDVAKAVEIHQSKQHGEMISMHAVPEFKIGAGEMLRFEHGGYHIMLIGLSKNLRKGDQIKLTLNFKHAGKINLSVPVLKMGRHHGAHGH